MTEQHQTAGDSQAVIVYEWTDKRRRDGYQRLHAIVPTRRHTFACGSRFNDWGFYRLSTEELDDFPILGDICPDCRDMVTKWETQRAATPTASDLAGDPA